MSEAGLFIYRPVAEQDLAVVHDMQTALAEVPSFRPTTMPHVAVLPRHLTRDLGPVALDRLTWKFPDTALDDIVFDVEGPALVQRHGRNMAYILQLEDASNVYRQESDLFRKRTLRRRAGSVSLSHSVHLTLGSVDHKYAFHDTLELLEGCVPDHITCGGIVTDPKRTVKLR